MNWHIQRNCLFVNIIIKIEFELLILSHPKKTLEKKPNRKQRIQTIPFNIHIIYLLNSILVRFSSLQRWYKESRPTSFKTWWEIVQIIQKLDGAGASASSLAIGPGAASPLLLRSSNIARWGLDFCFSHRAGKYTPEKYSTHK